MASPRDTSQLASQPQRDTYSQGSRTLGRSVVAASEADSSEMGSTRDATPQAFEVLQRKIERLEKKLKTTDERCSYAEAELFKCQGEKFSLHKKLREAESEAEQERESLEQEVIQLKTRQPTEDSSYTAQLVAGNTFLQERTLELKETYERALVYRRGRDTRDDTSTQRVFEALRQNNDAIATFQETNSQLVHSFLHSREEKRDEDKSADGDLEEEVRLAFGDHVREGHPESESSTLAETPFRSRWDPENPKFQGTLEESREPPLGFGSFSGGSSSKVMHHAIEGSVRRAISEFPNQSRLPGSSPVPRTPPVSSRETEPNRPGRAKGVPEMAALDLGLPAKEETATISEAPPQDKIKMEETTEPAKVTSRPHGSETTLQADPQPALVSVDKTMTQEAKEAEEPIYRWVAQQRAEAREQESQNLSSTEKPRAAYSEVAKTETPPVKPTTGVASSSKTVLKPGTNPKAKLSPRTPDLPEATTTQPSPSVTGGKTDMPLREKEPQKGDSKPSNSTPVSQAISEPPQYASLPEQTTGFWRRGPRLAEAKQAIPEDSRDEGQAEGAKGHVEDSTNAPKAPIGTGGSTAGIPATSGAGRGKANNGPGTGPQNQGHRGGKKNKGQNPRGAPRS